MQDHIYIKGARENNLKNIDVTIPRDKLVVLTGLSGSGKSSLVNEILYKKLGVVSKTRGALGILTITPSEAAIIGADVATKAAEVEIVFVDRFSGSLVVCGDVAAVDAALKDVLRVLGEVLHFTLTDITRS